MVKGLYLAALILAVVAAVFALGATFLNQSVEVGRETLDEVDRLLADSGHEVEVSPDAYAVHEALIRLATLCYVVLGLLAALLTVIEAIRRR